MKISWINNYHDNDPKADEVEVGALAEKLEKATQVGKKNGLAIVYGTFAEGQKRRTENMTSCTALALDIDNGITQPDELLELFPYELIAYSSYNHTSDSPRFRVIIPFSESIHPSEYLGVWRWAVSVAGPVFDDSKKAPNSIFFTPRLVDEESRDDHWIRYQMGSRLDPKEVALPDAEKKENNSGPTGTGFDDAAIALTKLDPERAKNYDSWLQVGMACKAADDSSDMLAAWDAWSQRSSDNYESGACEKKWDTFDSGKESRLTVASLVSWARQDETKKTYTETKAPLQDGKKDLGSHDPDWTPAQIQTFYAAKRVYEVKELVKDQYGQFYEYDGVSWSILTKDNLLNFVFVVSENLKYPPSPSRDKNVADRVGNHFFFPGEIQWNKLSDSEVPFLNGVVDIETGELRDHRKNDYLDSVFPHSLNLSAKCPNWERVLLDWFPSDPERRMRLQEFFGYVLLPHAKYKKALLAVGRPDCGKTIVQAMLVAMTGPDGYCSIPLSHMSSPRHRVLIQGKRFNYVSDPSDQEVIASEGWKSMVSTGEPIQLDPKNQQPFMYTPIAKHAIFANDVPSVDDSSGATEKRFLPVYFDRSIPVESQDRDLFRKLENEIQGIINWAITGAQRLIANNGQFTGSSRSDEYVYGKRTMRNPLLTFVEEALISAPNGKASVSKLYDLYESGPHESMTLHTFSKQVSRANYEIRRIQIENVRKSYIMGYTIRPELSAKVRTK